MTETASQPKGDIAIGLALGGGSALGFGHIPVLEVLDELGVKPRLIAGTSMGAIIGACYAAGHSAREITEFFTGLRRDPWLIRRLWRMRPRAITDLFGPNRSTAGQLDPEIVLGAVGDLVPADFAELSIPLRVIATDFFAWTEAVLEAGPLRRAIAASMALPLIFRPVMIDGRAMIDGGIVNTLPFEQAAIAGGVTIAVDVLSGPLPRRRTLPGRIEVAIGASQIMMRTITQEKLRRTRPDILVEPDVGRFRFFEFGRAAAIIAAAAPVKDDLKRRLEVLLG